MKKIALGSTLLLLQACLDGNSSSSSSQNNTQTVQGFAADGYLANALVCLDTTENDSCYDESPTAKTDAEGRFELEVTDADLQRYNVLVQAIQGQTIDLDEPDNPVSKNFTLKTSPVLHDDNSDIAVTPITTVVTNEIALETSITGEPDAREAVDLHLETSPFVNSVCPPAVFPSVSAMKNCVNSDYIAESNSDDNTTSTLAKRRHLVARIITEIAADAEEAVNSGAISNMPTVMNAVNQTLVEKGTQVVSDVDKSIAENSGDLEAVDENNIANKHMIVSAEGTNAVINQVETATQTIATADLLSQPLYRFYFSSVGVRANSILPGKSLCIIFCNDDVTHRYRENLLYPNIDDSQDELDVAVNIAETHIGIETRNSLGTNTWLELGAEAERISLNKRSMAQWLNTHAPDETRDWADVLTECSKFSVAAEGYLLDEITTAEVINPAFAHFSSLPASVVPEQTAQKVNLSRIMENYATEVGSPFTVFIGPQITIVLDSNNSAEFFDVSDINNIRSLGQVSYELAPMPTWAGLAEVAIIDDFALVEGHELYINLEDGELLGIGVGYDRWLRNYGAKRFSGNFDEDEGFGVGVFGANFNSGKELYLNQVATNQLTAALDLDKIRNSAHKASPTECGFVNKAGSDSDMDGVDDNEDDLPSDPTEHSDLDNDGIGDNSDPDRDGDNVANEQDDLPDNPHETLDSDGDGTGDNSDTDRDGDNVSNEDDSAPDDPNQSGEGDGGNDDGINCDQIPADAEVIPVECQIPEGGDDSNDDSVNCDQIPADAQNIPQECQIPGGDFSPGGDINCDQSPMSNAPLPEECLLPPGGGGDGSPFDEEIN